MKNKKLTLKEKIIWLAAAIDGEGCVTINYTPWKSQSKTPYILSPHIEVGNNVKDFCSMCKYCANNGSVLYDKSGNCYNWYASSKREVMIVLLNNLLPFLTVKKKQAKIVLDFCISRRQNYHKPYTAKERNLRNQIIKMNSGKTHHKTIKV